jgi:hypothetical protein
MANFGLFRGFSEKLFQGELPVNLGFIGSENFGFDVDSAAYFSRVTAVGGVLTQTEQDAVDALVKTMKTNNIWTKMKAIYPMVGASSAACSRNLKSDNFNGAFTTGWTFTSAGAKPDGTGHMDTNLNVSTSLSLNSLHFSNYFPNFAAEGRSQIGAFDANNGTYAYYNFTALGALIRINSNDNVFNGTNQGSQSGLRIVSRTSSTSSKVYVNNTNTFSSSLASTGLTNANMFIAARNTNGIAGDKSSLLQSFCTIGDGLSDAEAALLYNVIQSFQTTLGRAVAP